MKLVSQFEVPSKEVNDSLSVALTLTKWSQSGRTIHKFFDILNVSTFPIKKRYSEPTNVLFSKMKYAQTRMK